MKKIVILLVLVIIIVAGISYTYLKYETNLKIAQKENFQYENYFEKEVQGSDVATVINKAIDSNTKNEVQKDSKGLYIDNEQNSIKIDIKFTDNDTTYNMETIYSGGTDKFVQYYSEIKFKCTKIEYHQKTNRIKYMLFEQKTQ